MTKSQKIVFLDYSGLVLYETIGNLIIKIKETMFEALVKQAVYKKVLMIMIEALENIFKYSEYFEKEYHMLHDYAPKINIISENKIFVIECANPIRKSDVSKLKSRLDHVNSLDKLGIKEEYKRIITNGQFSEKGGAGLGIIEMAKISDGTLEYSFSPINEQYDYYTLRINIYGS